VHHNATTLVTWSIADQIKLGVAAIRPKFKDAVAHYHVRGHSRIPGRRAVRGRNGEIPWRDSESRRLLCPEDAAENEWADAVAGGTQDRRRGRPGRMNWAH
jgi:hypothetical protein